MTDIPSYLVINSKNKNDIYETSTNFSYTLSKPVRITKYIRLVYCAIPESSYLITPNNNEFRIQFVDGFNKTIKIPSQNYSPDVLGILIKALVNYQAFLWYTMLGCSNIYLHLT